MKYLIKIVLILFIILIPVGIWIQYQAINKGKKHFEVFNAADIDNYIESVRIAYKGTEIKLDDGREFIFYPITDNNLNSGNIFNYTAEKGDKIVKKPYGNIVYLLKNNEKLAYKFQKF